MTSSPFVSGYAKPNHDPALIGVSACEAAFQHHHKHNKVKLNEDQLRLLEGYACTLGRKREGVSRIQKIEQPFVPSLHFYVGSGTLDGQTNLPRSSLLVENGRIYQLRAPMVTLDSEGRTTRTNSFSKCAPADRFDCSDLTTILTRALKKMKTAGKLDQRSFAQFAALLVASSSRAESAFIIQQPSDISHKELRELFESHPNSSGPSATVNCL